MKLLMTILIIFSIVGPTQAWEYQGLAPWLSLEEHLTGSLLTWGPDSGILVDIYGEEKQFTYDPGLVYWEGTLVGAQALALAHQQNVYVQVSPTGVLNMFNPYRTLYFQKCNGIIWTRSINGRDFWERFTLEGWNEDMDGQILLVKVSLTGNSGVIPEMSQQIE